MKSSPRTGLSSQLIQLIGRIRISSTIAVMFGVLLLLLLSGGAGRADTIAAQGFETSGGTWPFTFVGGITNTDAGTADTPANQRILAGSASWGIFFTNSTLTFGTVNVNNYSSVSVTVRVASPSASSSNGSDTTDHVSVYAALNGAAFSATPDITLGGNSNARWGYTATQTGSTTAGTPITLKATSGTSTANYSTLIVTIPNGTTNIALKIYGTNDSAGEMWCLDGITLTGTLLPPASPVLNVAPSTNSTSFTANWNAASSATGYDLDVATDSGFSSFLTGYNNRDVGNVTTASVTGLTSSTTYYYRVRAYNASGSSGNSITNSVTTLAASVPYMLVTLPGQTSPNMGTPTTQTAGNTFNVTVIATTDGVTQDNSYTGPHNIAFTLASGSSVTPVSASVSFSGGLGTASITLTNTTVSTITATDGTIAGTPSSSLNINPGAIASYAVTVATPQTVGIPFNVSVTAVDAYGNIVTSDSSTSVTLSSGSGNMLFDTNPKTLASGTITVNATDNTVETTTITATDGNNKTGTSGNVMINPPPTYHWVATSGSADWTVAASWSPSRTTPGVTDTLVFDGGGSSTATSVPAQTVKQLQVSGNTTITLQAGGVNTFTIAGGANVLTVANGSTLNVSGANALTISLPTGSSGNISGIIDFAGGAHQLAVADASGIAFQNGATFTADTGFTGNAFGATSLNSVVFASGSTYVEKAGSNPFGATLPNSVVVFQPGSLFSVQAHLTPSTSGRTYANFELNSPGANLTGTGASALSIDNLTITAGALSLNLAGTYNQRGNISVAAGATLNLTNSGNGATITLNGTTPQTISGAGALTVGANESLTIASGSMITLQRDLGVGAGLTVASGGTLAGSSTVTGIVTVNSGGTIAPGAAAIGTLTFNTAPTFAGTSLLGLNRTNSPVADEIVLSSGTLTYGGTLTVTNLGSSLQAGDSFTLYAAPTFSGWFSSLTLPALPAGLLWDTNSLATQGVLDVYSFVTNGVGALSTRLNTPVTFAKSKVLAFTAGGSGGLTVTVTGAPAHGSAVTNATQITYTPAANYSGNDVFYVTVSDVNSSVTVQVNVTVIDPSNPVSAGNSGNLIIRDLGNGSMRLYITGTANTTYILQTNGSISTSGWGAYQTIMLPSTGVTNFDDTAAPGARFYRTVLP
ncbi:MAG TPA: Ig-like domain-containing protein [Verrucomicrobiae bacterium]